MSDIDKFMQGLGSAPVPICDDCLTAVVGWGQRQRANAIGRQLHAGGRIERKSGVCQVCGNTKTVSAVTGAPRVAEQDDAPAQARHWFSSAIFDAVLYRGERRDIDIAVGLPDGFGTYQKLAMRVGWLKEGMPFRLFWVSEDGTVREE